MKIISKKKYTRIIETILDGLYCEGGHHKQYYFEELLTILTGKSVDTLRDENRYEPGIPE